MTFRAPTISELKSVASGIKAVGLGAWSWSGAARLWTWATSRAPKEAQAVVDAKTDLDKAQTEEKQKLARATLNEKYEKLEEAIRGDDGKDVTPEELGELRSWIEFQSTREDWRKYNTGAKLVEEEADVDVGAIVADDEKEKGDSAKESKSGRAITITKGGSTVGLKRRVAGVDPPSRVPVDDENLKRLRQKLTELQALPQLISGALPTGFQRAIQPFQALPYKSIGTDSNYREGIFALTALLNERLLQFRYIVTQQAAKRIEESIGRDASSLFQLLDGVREFLRFISNLEFKTYLEVDEENPDNLKEIPKSVLVNRWRAMFEELNELVTRAVQCPLSQTPVVSNVLSAVESAASSSTFSHATEDARQRVRNFYLASFKYAGEPAFRNKKFALVYGVGHTGKNLLVSNMVNDLANHLQKWAYGPDGPFYAAPLLQELRPEDFLSFHEANAADIRDRSNVTPTQLVGEIRKWLICASNSASVNFVQFAGQGLGTTFQKMSVLHIENFDHLFKTDAQLKAEQGGKSIPDAIEDANQAFKTQLEVKSSKSQTPVQVADQKQVEYQAKLKTAEAVAAATAAEAKVADIKAAMSTVKSGGSHTHSKSGGLVGDAGHRNELGQLLLDLFKDEQELSKYPNVWVIFSVRTPWVIPSDLLQHIKQAEVTLDLPSDAIRHGIIRTEWQRQFRQAWLNRVERVDRVMRMSGYTVFGVDGKTVAAEFKSKAPTMTLTGDPKTAQTVNPNSDDLKSRNPSIAEAFAQYKSVHTSGPDGAFTGQAKLDELHQKWNKPGGRWGLESYLMLYLWEFYTIATIRNSNLPTLTPADRRRVMEQVYDHLISQTPTRNQPTNERGYHAYILQDVRARMEASILDSSPSRLAASLTAASGISRAGACMLRASGISRGNVDHFLKQGGRSESDGRFGFGLNLDEMYLLLARVAEETRREWLSKEVLRTRTYYRRNITHPACASLAIKLEPENEFDPHSQWIVPEPQSRPSVATVETNPSVGTPPTSVTKTEPAVAVAASECAGQLTIENMDPVMVELNYWWTSDTVSRAIDSLSTPRAFGSKAEYIDFVRYVILGEAKARGSRGTYPSAAECKALEPIRPTAPTKLVTTVSTSALPLYPPIQLQQPFISSGMLVPLPRAATGGEHKKKKKMLSAGRSRKIPKKRSAAASSSKKLLPKKKKAVEVIYF